MATEYHIFITDDDGNSLAQTDIGMVEGLTQEEHLQSIMGAVNYGIEHFLELQGGPASPSGLVDKNRSVRRDS
jgi:hypothetical protein